SVTLNGKPLDRFWLTHGEVMAGGTLVFEMTDRPSHAWPPSSGRFPAFSGAQNSGSH
ncbi:MAG TPA: glycoside hydrolase domain-containing protein, partial [Acidobacteriaceae bacterium]|nr:glycoside hydrolase domain-containing protein [Acidobacteriaceae bacterium]